MSDSKDLVLLKPTLPAQSSGAKKILSQVMDDALAIAKVLNKSSTKVENEKWNGGVYSGDLVDGKRHGKGKMTLSYCLVYKGNLVYYKIHGRGMHAWPSGHVYSGDLVDGKRHGKGTHTLSDGNQVYEGDYVDDKMHGKGKTTWSDGHCYEGGYVDDKMHGKGKFTYVNGTSQGGCWDGGSWDWD